MQRREFLLLGGATAAWPLAARAQQPERMRRISVLSQFAENDADWPRRAAAFRQGFAEQGWLEGRNLTLDFRFSAGDAERVHAYAAELVERAPDVIIATTGQILGALLQVTRTVPIVFAGVIDPVGGGWVKSLARPGGNATGFSQFEFGMGVKWLELLKEIAPRVTRAAVIRNPTTPAGSGQFGAIQGAAPFFRIEPTPVDERDPGEMERAITAFAREPNGGLIVTGGASTTLYRDQIIALAAQHRLPAVYPQRHFVAGGGLLCYGPDPTDQYRRAAGYVDRILKGEKPADLPVQAPTRYETVLNMKTARALGLDVPATVLVRVDEVIE
jgi:putative ABC transport system substrate-binding protein